MTPTPMSAAQAMTPAAPPTRWEQLPAAVRAAVEQHTGPVHHAETISAGLNATFTAQLHTGTGLVFAKGTHSTRAAAQRREAFINPYVHPISPRLLWLVETSGWHVLGFGFLHGRPADLSPGSPDLPAVTRMLTQLADLNTPNTGCRRIEDRWADAARQAGADPTLLAGDHLLHTDLNPHNILITQHGARLVDWSWPTLGAPWIDTACTALWLIAEGHTPTEAERWAAENPAWAEATRDAIDAFTAINAALWTQIAADVPSTWKRRLRDAAAAWRRHRTPT
ncbi:phosphotransferase family protein [Amycolatopsis thermoflava]|uniref:phosphotransferase family protein n=1 Tax=Amycolatopsis thermoflava TaxID=84480 RepID=UPI00382D847F